MRIFNKLFGPPNVDRLKRKNNIKGLIRALEYRKSYNKHIVSDTDNEVRRDAAIILGEMGDERALEPLIQALENHKKYYGGRIVTNAAAEALGKFQDTRAIVPLIETVSDYRYGWIVRNSLMKFGKRAIIGPLIHFISDKNPLSPGIIALLSEIGDIKVVVPLVKALSYEDTEARESACGGLIKIGNPAVEFLVHVIKDESENVNTRSDIRNILVGIGEPAVEKLIQALSDDILAVREDAAVVLRKIGDKRAVEPFAQALKDSDGFFRSTVALALGEMGDVRAVEPLIQELKDKGNDDNCRRVVEAILVGIGEPAIEQLIQALKMSYFVRSVAEDTLKRIVKDVTPIIYALKDPNEDIRERIAEILGTIGGERAVEPLIQAMTDSNINVRFCAAQALGRLGDTRAIESLIQALEGIKTIAYETSNYSEVEKENYACFRRSVEKALGSIAIKTIPQVVVELWNMAFGSDEDRSRGNISGKLVHTQNSVEAVRSLCRIKSPVVSNILYKISKAEDKHYRAYLSIGTRIDDEWEGTLSFEEHRQVASKELERRNFMIYNPADYFISDGEARDLKTKASEALKKLRQTKAKK